MTESIENLILDLLEWVGRKERRYQETMDAWRTFCPRLTIWEDAIDQGLLQRSFENGVAMVRLTPAGFDLLRAKRPQVTGSAKIKPPERR